VQTRALRTGSRGSLSGWALDSPILVLRGTAGRQVGEDLGCLEGSSRLKAGLPRRRQQCRPIPPLRSFPEASLKGSDG
jgi:hypothetical protein